jgi:hypothetical protein
VGCANVAVSSPARRRCDQRERNAENRYGKAAHRPQPNLDPAWTAPIQTEHRAEQSLRGCRISIFGGHSRTLAIRPFWLSPPAEPRCQCRRTSRCSPAMRVCSAE